MLCNHVFDSRTEYIPSVNIMQVIVSIGYFKSVEILSNAGSLYIINECIRSGHPKQQFLYSVVHKYASVEQEACFVYFSGCICLLQCLHLESVLFLF